MDKKKLKQQIENSLEKTNIHDQQLHTKQEIKKELKRLGFKAKAKNTDKLLQKLVENQVLATKKIDGETKYYSKY